MKKFLLIILGLSLSAGVGIYVGMIVKDTAFATTDKDTSISDIPPEKLEEQKVSVEEITVKLTDDHYARVSFSFVVNTKEGAEELSKRDFQVKDQAIKQLSDMDSESLKNKDGSEALVKNLKNYMNEHMKEGQILEAYISEKLIQ